MRRLSALGALVILAACGGSSEPESAPTTEPPTSTEAEPTQARLDLGGPVHEPRLVHISDRIRLAEGRNRHDGDAVVLAQTRQRLAESCLALAEVGAEADVGDHELTLEKDPSACLSGTK